MNIKTKSMLIDAIGIVLVILGVTYCGHLAIEAMPAAPCEKTQSC